jgi:hypothetical protein
VNERDWGCNQVPKDIRDCIGMAGPWRSKERPDACRGMVVRTLTVLAAWPPSTIALRLLHEHREVFRPNPIVNRASRQGGR